MGRYGRSMVRMPYILRRKLLSRKRLRGIPVVQVIFVSSLLLFLSFFAVLLPSSITPSFAANGSEVSGIISQNTTWTLAGNPYIVTGNIVVNSGMTLTIEAGVEVRFDSGKALQINGELIARGNAGNNIVFTSNKTTPAPGDWGYILFGDTSTDATFDSGGNYVSGSVLQYCKVLYGGANNAGGAIKINSSSPFIDNCRIENNASRGIQAGGTVGLRLTNNTVTGNTSSDSGGGGIYVGGTQVTIANNIISNNTANAYGNWDGGGGIRVDGQNITISGNTISENTANGPNFWANGGGGVFFGSGTTVTIKDNTITKNTSGGFGGGIYEWLSV